MSYSKLLLSQFTEFHEKQDMLTKLTSKEILKNYGHSTIHCIDLIEKLEDPNVTKLALKLSMSRSAISKIIKKLLDGGDIESYQYESNKKEIYYKLTQRGKILFNEHLKRHSAWLERDEKFFQSVDDKDLKIIIDFFSKYNEYLGDQINQLKGCCEDKNLKSFKANQLEKLIESKEITSDDVIKILFNKIKKSNSEELKIISECLSESKKD